MNYFMLEYDMNKYEKDGIMAHHGDLHGLDMYDVTKGKQIDNWDERVTFLYNEDEGNIITDYICNSLGWLIVSENVKNIMIDEGILGVQYLPVHIINKKDNTKLGSYYVANIYNLVEAVDMEKSEYLEMIPGVYSFISYTIRESSVNNLDIYRLKESDVSLFVSERFTKIVRKNKLTGFSFSKVKVV